MEASLREPLWFSGMELVRLDSPKKNSPMDKPTEVSVHTSLCYHTALYRAFSCSLTKARHDTMGQNFHFEKQHLKGRIDHSSKSVRQVRQPATCVDVVHVSSIYVESSVSPAHVSRSWLLSYERCSVNEKFWARNLQYAWSEALRSAGVHRVVDSATST